MLRSHLDRDVRNYTFSLPPGVNASHVTVVNENRTVAISSGKFTDSFTNEESYHTYKISSSDFWIWITRCMHALN